MVDTHTRTHTHTHTHHQNTLGPRKQHRDTEDRSRKPEKSAYIRSKSRVWSRKTELTHVGN